MVSIETNIISALENQYRDKDMKISYKNFFVA